MLSEVYLEINNKASMVEKVPITVRSVMCVYVPISGYNPQEIRLHRCFRRKVS